MSLTLIELVLLVIGCLVVNAARSPPTAYLGTSAVVTGGLLMLLSLFIYSIREARADSRLPLGVTCEQVVRYAADLNIPDTFAGRAQARVIALTFGH